MQNTADGVAGSTSMDDRFAGQIGYHNGRREIGGVPTATGTAEVPLRGTALDGPLSGAPSLSLGDLDGMGARAFTSGDWVDSAASLADHPLLRGLLLELPPKGSMPTSAWLDRWFEAARSILELLYVQNSDPFRRDRLTG